MKFVKSFFTFILSSIALLFLIIFVIVNGTSKLVSKDNIIDIFNNIKLTDIIDESDFNDINSSFTEAGLDIDSKDIMENEELKEVVGTYMSDVLTSIISGKEMEELSENEVSKKLKGVVDSVVSEAEKNNIEVKEEDIKEVYAEIDNNIQEITNNINDFQKEINDSIKDNEDIKNLDEVFKYINTIYNIRFIFLAITLVCLIIVGLMYIKKFKFADVLGKIDTIFGSILLIFGIFLSSIWDAFIDNTDIVNVNDGAIKIIEPCINTYKNVHFVYGGIFFTVGVALLITYGIIKRKKLKKS